MRLGGLGGLQARRAMAVVARSNLDDLGPRGANEPHRLPPACGWPPSVGTPKGLFASECSASIGSQSAKPFKQRAVVSTRRALHFGVRAPRQPLLGDFDSRGDFAQRRLHQAEHERSTDPR